MDEARSPFHIGEKRVQQRLGVADEIEAFARKVVRDHLPDQHRDFYRQLPFLMVGTVDEDGQPWASLIPGNPGFISSPDDQILAIAAQPLAGDPLNEILRLGAEIGLLGIQLETRRRNRATGRVSAVGDQGFEIAVGQTFGNCPQYIQTRAVQYRPPLDTSAPAPVTVRSDRLTKRMSAIIAAADTLFIATAYADSAENWAYGADVSHRGGKPGFVKIEDDHSFVFPDFRGNNHFNTVGNIELNPRVGFLFPDFRSGDLLYIAGDAEIVWSGPEVEAFQGAERLIRIAVRSTILVEDILPLTFAFDSYSPLLETVGSWDEAAAELEAKQECNRYRDYEVFDVQRESRDIKSYYLRRADGGDLPTFEPGQFLPIQAQIPGVDQPVTRTYTLSDTPNAEFFRLSIKDEGDSGLVSHHFHNDVAPGSRIAALPPRGKFVPDVAGDRPVVLLSAGVGVTPMIAMAKALACSDGDPGGSRRIFFLHGTQNGETFAFGSEIREIAARCPSFSAHICFSDPSDRDAIGTSHDHNGRITIGLLKQILPFDDFDFFLCGPAGFMQSLHDGLSELGVQADRINYEAFGPSTLQPRSNEPREAAGASGLSDNPVAVRFAQTDTVASWTPGQGSLLELAESAGAEPTFSCRSGVCGSCATRLLCGSVDYHEDPIYPTADDEVLICCATPRVNNGEQSCGKDLDLVLEL